MPALFHCGLAATSPSLSLSLPPSLSLSLSPRRIVLFFSSTVVVLFSRERRSGDKKGRGRDADNVAEAASALSLVGDALGHIHHVADLRLEYRLEISSPVSHKYLADPRNEDGTRRAKLNFSL